MVRGAAAAGWRVRLLRRWLASVCVRGRAARSHVPARLSCGSDARCPVSRQKQCSPPSGCGVRSTSTTSSSRSPSTAPGPRGTPTLTTAPGKSLKADSRPRSAASALCDGTQLNNTKICSARQGREKKQHPESPRVCGCGVVQLHPDSDSATFSNLTSLLVRPCHLRASPSPCSD